ncbi:hypothetical protein GL218_08768 [Daldinia childiae]|uniref:uncharacterized protein n=1 Tax=Daldinia childiae TaxID=326645 RepID=UPI0014488FC2|nr:uncharacterized protein GL218_08768 [Daldinia childiae]KAF3067104.1 hypothetical protein GL218_08768 [Daldinia childiae]
MGFEIAKDSHQTAAFIVCLITAPTCIAATTLRFIATRRNRRRIGWEDWFALLALIFYLVYVALLLYVLVTLNGRNPFKPGAISQEQFYNIEVAIYVLGAQFCLQQLFAKFSLLFLYYRFFSRRRSFVIWVWIVGIIQLLWSVATYLVHYFACIPPKKSWTPTAPGHCINNPAFLAGGESINSLLDFALVGLAIWMVQALHMKTVVKIQLCFLFALGGLAGVFGFVKIAQAFDNSYVNNILDAIWATIQQACGVICCCAPMCRSLLPRLSLYERFRVLSTRVFSTRTQDHQRPSQTSNLHETPEKGAGGNWRPTESWIRLESNDQSSTREPAVMEIPHEPPPTYISHV